MPKKIILSWKFSLLIEEGTAELRVLKEVNKWLMLLILRLPFGVTEGGTASLIKYAANKGIPIKIYKL